MVAARDSSLSHFECSLPELYLTGTVEGPCFRLEVQATREGERLVIRSMRVVASSVDGVARVQYLFDSPLEPEGAAQLAPLLVQIRATQDVEFLKKIFQVTQAYSLGEWEAHLLSSASRADHPFLQTRVPSFESFCEEPAVLSRHFSCCKKLSSGGCLTMNGSIAGWGEFLELEILLEKDSEPRLPLCYLTIFLPDRTSRTYGESYAELKAMLTSFAVAFADDGLNGLFRLLADTSYQFMARPSGYDGARVDWASVEACPGFYADNVGIEVPTLGILVRREIRSQGAHISITSTQGSGLSEIIITFSPGPRCKALSATHIRCIASFFQHLTTPRSDGPEYLAQFVLQKLTEQAADTKGNTPPSRKTPRLDSLESLEVCYSVKHPGAAQMLSQSCSQQLARENRCFEAAPSRHDPRVIRELLTGVRHLILSLEPTLTTLRPELFHTLILCDHPDGSLEVRATTNLGCFIEGSVPLPPSSIGDTISRLKDSLATLFSLQQQGGWAPLLFALQKAVASFEGELQSDFPLEDIDVAQRYCDVAGTITHLVTRSGVPGLRGILRFLNYREALLSLEWLGRGVAADLTFVNSRITAAHFKSLATSGTPGVLNWRTVGTLNHKGFYPEPDRLSQLILCLRTFFRELMAAEASALNTPEDMIFRDISRTLLPLGFEDPGS